MGKLKIHLLYIVIIGLLLLSLLFFLAQDSTPYTVLNGSTPKMLIYKAEHRLAIVLQNIALKFRSGGSTDFVYTAKDGGSTETTFIALEKKIIPLQVARPGVGGGLTSFGNKVLVLTHNGDIYQADEHSALKTEIATPDYGWADFRRLASQPEYENYTFDPIFKTQPRFHDILYYEEQAGGHLLVSYTDWSDAGQCYATAVARLNINASERPVTLFAKATDWEVLYKTKPCLPLSQTGQALSGYMAGSRMAMNPARHTLLLAVGEYGTFFTDTPSSVVGLNGSDYGKVLDINLDNGEATRISFGHRNMQGVLVSKDQNIWVVEHGVRGGDELNQVVSGGDYGWPYEALGTDYDKKPRQQATEYGRLANSIRPVYAWLPSIGISNIIQIEKFHPAWDGDFLVASLLARELFRIAIYQGRVLFVEPIWIGSRIRYALAHTDGFIVLWTDDNELVFLKARELVAENKNRE